MDNDSIKIQEDHLEFITNEVWALVAGIRQKFDQNLTKEDEEKLLEIEDAIRRALNLPERGD